MVSIAYHSCFHYFHEFHPNTYPSRYAKFTSKFKTLPTRGSNFFPIIFSTSLCSSTVTIVTHTRAHECLRACQISLKSASIGPDTPDTPDLLVNRWVSSPRIKSDEVPRGSQVISAKSRAYSTNNGSAIRGSNRSEETVIKLGPARYSNEPTANFPRNDTQK